VIVRRCRHTSSAGLFPLLSWGSLPLVKVEEISQTIDSENFTVQNYVPFSAPLATTSLVPMPNLKSESPRIYDKFVEKLDRKIIYFF